MFLDPKKIIRHAPVKASHRVGDFGTGAGHYAHILGERLGAEGSVYAFDAFTPHLDALRRAWSAQAQLYAIESDLNTHIPIRNNLLHTAVVANVLHQIEKKGRFISELERVMEPGGSVLVVDWVSSFKNMGPPKEVVLAPSETVRMFRSFGFSVGDMLPAGTHHFAFLAVAPKETI
ncbi:methyltransferase domain-containing protein [Patescibacteria group bacterium]|nr:MAG: methyltransferase domain-containing protein [Patescibacteria group bacterium]